MAAQAKIDVSIPTDHHVFIAGSTGSGKSVLAEIYLAGYEHVIKLDTKGEVFERRAKGEKIWRGLQEGEDYTVIEHLAEIGAVQTPKIIYAPDFDEQEPEFYNALFKYVYERQNTILWIDELMSVAETTNTSKIPYLKALYTRGRSKCAVIWALTQRPMDIPAICMASSQHFFVFDLPQPQDRKKVVDLSGCIRLLEMPGKYNFWYYKIGAKTAVKARLQI